MSVTYTTVYTKNGAVFASAQEAQTNKNLLYSPELKQSVNDCFTQLLLDGVLLEPVSAAWNQDTFELTINTIVSSEEAFLATPFPFVFDDIVSASSKTGWTFVRKFLS